MLELKPDHSWKAKSGYKIFVVDRGAVRFLVPEDWVVKPDKHSIRFFDSAPPNDNCRLECSYLRIPATDWSGLPISELITAAMKDDPRFLIRQGEINQSGRQDLEMAWTEFAFADPSEHRPARTRVCLARGRGIQCLITLDLWLDDAGRIESTWQEVIRTVKLGEYVLDPAKGD